MKDRWSTVASVQSDDLDALVHQSRLIGDETKLVLRGGGNTSIKQERGRFSRSWRPCPEDQGQRLRFANYQTRRLPRRATR